MAELTAVIGAAPHERTPERLAQRNGHRQRLLATTAGDVELRAGRFFPSLFAASSYTTPRDVTKLS